MTIYKRLITLAASIFFTMSLVAHARIDCGTVNGVERCFECNADSTKCKEVPVRLF